MPREEVACCGVCGAKERALYCPSGDVVQCLGCGVLYVSPRPTADAIARFYSALGRYAHWDEQHGRAAMWRRRVARIRRHVPSGRLLDVGAGQGDFGAVARQYFEIDGTEVSTEGIRLAHERHGLALRYGDVNAIGLPRQHFDVVTLWHVLEHVAEPRALIARCRELLRPTGLLFVAVPNTDYLLGLKRAHLKNAWRVAWRRPADARLHFERLELLQHEEELHLTHFTLRTLEWLLRALGFDVCEAGLDDCSADTGLLPRLLHYGYDRAYRLTGLAMSPAIFMAARAPGV